VVTSGLLNRMRGLMRRKRGAWSKSTSIAERSSESSELASVCELASASADTIREFEIDVQKLSTSLSRLEAAVDFHLGIGSQRQSTDGPPAGSNEATMESMPLSGVAKKKETMH
jgi:hypothetical protein